MEINTKSTLVIKSDGGSRGNPGPSAAGIYITDKQSGKKIIGFAKYLGVGTNNEAEYKAVIEALLWVLKSLGDLKKEYSKIEFYSDSLLIVNQLKGLYKIKKPQLQRLYQRVNTLLLEIDIPLRFIHVKRENNIEPDLLLNNVLEKYIRGLHVPKKDV